MTRKATLNRATIPLRGPFSLRESALFGFGYADATDFDGVMRMVFRVDGDYESAAGVEVRQDGDELDLTIHGQADPEAVVAQTARILAVDVDATGFVELGERDEVIGALQAVAPGLRPPQFSSPYEAAAWGVISARKGRRGGMAIRNRINAAHGEEFELAGRTMRAFPAPSVLAGLDELPGVPAQRVGWLRSIAEAAPTPLLSVAQLRSLDPEAAKGELRRLPGIGEFYSALIVVRALGHTDVLSLEESITREAAARLYGFSLDISDADYTEFAERWRPWRTWAIVLIRAASGRLVSGAG